MLILSTFSLIHLPILLQAVNKPFSLLATKCQLINGSSNHMPLMPDGAFPLCHLLEILPLVHALALLGLLLLCLIHVTIFKNPVVRERIAFGNTRIIIEHKHRISPRVILENRLSAWV